ncbi:putative bifunctional diguanylate cyclase/phosphodiesterase [Paenibacillus sp. MMS18-CY102]|uniref:putative bifunctional diguanylate cyclase/phosphodiesterase n=1 Tax=Paenibacillus sp. MMS18-CY102 TaxID=2682849 RepID=UPI001365B2F1|nr:bifunctional diguanylate cyclase/phosphodiesterase [Paenibacillus sp. MMS18-CY102]MWC27836.1 EAL domain-containing protein [Paenibacillus sp. MMS18-CY102]
MIMLQGTYSLGIVALSFIIAALSSFSALHTIGRVLQAHGRSKLGWMFVGAVVMGCGIWSMHFVGMIAFHLNVKVTYDVSATALSLVAAIAASYIAFYLTQRSESRRSLVFVGGIVMGLGIAGMHYIGMSALRLPGEMRYDSFYVMLSVLVAIIVSYAALFLFSRVRTNMNRSMLRKWIAAALMGLAVCGMHYTGMRSVSFWCGSPEMFGESPLNLFLVSAVTAAMLLLLLISWGIVYIDRAVLIRMAYTDPLTGLPNRYELRRRFDLFLQRAQQGAVLFVDIDQFKTINDTLGHEVGDLLVLDASKRLAQLSESLQVFRIGGDEFLLIIPNVGQSEAEELAGQLLASIHRPFQLEGHELYVTCSVGISLFPEHGRDQSMLLKTADTAMYDAKSKGKNRFQLFNQGMEQRLVRRMALEKDLRRAMERGGEFVVYYQPKWDTRIGRPSGFEALVRWQHPELGLVPPSEFIPIAEETGLIVGLSRFVLQQACHDCLRWERDGYGELTVAVNTSVKLFDSHILHDMVSESLELCMLPPERLELEITESIVIHDMADVIRQLNEIRSLGVKVSMDDFGSGYSSLGTLDRIPIDTVKIDRMFVNESHLPAKQAIIRTIVTLAQQLNLEVVAEGVEEEQQVALLIDSGCPVIQGYYFGKPMDDIRVRVWLDDLAYKEAACGEGL